MDSYKAKFAELDPPQNGYLTKGEARVLSLTLSVNDSPVDISGVDTFEFSCQGSEATIVIPTTDIDLIDDGVDPDLLGRIDVNVAADVSDKILSQRYGAFMVKAITDSEPTIYWGNFDEVREPIL